MANETLQLIITADNREALKAIEDLAKSTSGLKTKFQEIKGDTNGAALALNNLSRIAQDAPYGFIGISNNINPLLESFQRLQASSGSTSSALKAMASSLMGPAGIGLAVGAVSSLLVVFGDKLFKASDSQKNATDKTKEHTEALKAEKNAIDQIYSSTANEVTQVYSLIAVLNNETESRNRKNDALERLKKINPEIFGSLKIEGNLVIGLTSAYNNYIQNLESVIAAKTKQQEIEKLTEEILKRKGILDTEEDKQIKATGASIKAFLDTKKNDDQLRREGLQTQVKVNKEEREYNDLIQRREKALKSLTEFSKGIKVGDGSQTKQASAELNSVTNEINAYIREFQDITSPTRAQRRKAVPSLFEINKGDTPNKLSNKPPNWYTETMTEKSTEAAKDLETLNTQLKLSAELTAVVASGFNNVFETFVNGGDVGKALEESFKRIAIQLIEMVAQALIFKAILTALGVGATPLGAAALDSGMGFGGGGLLGQFLLKGSDLVLATQRANSNLNLRR
jgi:hypothetical protein